jgi:hypothetical protein
LWLIEVKFTFRFVNAVLIVSFNFIKDGLWSKTSVNDSDDVARS